MYGIFGIGQLMGNSGGGTSLMISFPQTSPTFSIGDAVRWTGTNWIPSQADTLDDSSVFGFVTGLVSGQYILTIGGLVDGLSGLTPGTVYYLSSTTAGKLTDVAPTIAKPILYALTSTSGIFYNQWLGSGGGGVSPDEQTITCNGTDTIYTVTNPFNNKNGITSLVSYQDGQYQNIYPTVTTSQLIWDLSSLGDPSTLTGNKYISVFLANQL